MLPLELTGDPNRYRAVLATSGELEVSSGIVATLDVPAQFLTAEAALIASPRRFAGIEADNDAATENVARIAPALVGRWIEKREAFFSAISASAGAQLGDEGRRRASLYLADFTAAPMHAAALEYVETYIELLRSLVSQARTGATQATIEPVLLCDRASEGPDHIRIAPTHPLSVSVFASIQLSFLSSLWPNENDRTDIIDLLAGTPLGGVLPWIPWRGKVLESLQAGPLLWRQYGSPGSAEVDTDDDLAVVITAKVKRLLMLSPHVNRSAQILYLNVDVGTGNGQYLVEALRNLCRNEAILCRFDVGVVSDFATPALVHLFEGRPIEATDETRAALEGRVRVARLKSVDARPAHLAFRMAAANAERTPFTSLSENSPFVRDCGFAGGLSQEPVRFALSSADQVQYEQYVSTNERTDTSTSEDLWDGPWRRRFLQLSQLSRKLAVGLRATTAGDLLPSRRLVQVARPSDSAGYTRSFVTVHCDPAQGPEFFVGPRSGRSGVFLVECSDRGAPELPGRDIVSVTTHIAPFRAALTTALQALPQALRDLVDDNVAKGLLRDINLLRGTEVYDFMREATREGPNSTGYMGGLDNVLALRFLLSAPLAANAALPVVVGMRDLTARSPKLRHLRSGTHSDDVMVFYLPAAGDDQTVIFYRLVEVKYGPRRNQWRKAQKQLDETSIKLRQRLPIHQWSDGRTPGALLLERDLAWAIHETIERYRAFGLIDDDDALENRWGLRHTLSAMHRGEFALSPGGFDCDEKLWEGINGTAIMLDPDIPGRSSVASVENDTEYLTISRELVAQLLVTQAQLVLAGDSFTQRTSCPCDAQGGETDVSIPTSPPPVISKQPLAEEGSPDVPATGGDVSPQASLTPVRQAAGEAHRPRIDAVFAGFVGNTGPVDRIKRDLRYAAIEGHRWLDPVGLFGPKSTGKTELARRIAQALDVPRLELSEALVTSADDLAARIKDTAASATAFGLLGGPLRVRWERIVACHGV